MKNRRWIASALLAVGLLTTMPAALAEEPAAEPPSEPVAVHEQIVVTASRTERPMGQLAVHATVVDARAMELSAAQTVDDLLKNVPGFNLTQQGSSRVMHPSIQSLSIRGVGGTSTSRTLVLLDGQPLNDPFGGWVYWGRVPIDGLERVEVVRGSGASVWGNGTLGGVVHLITRRPEARRLALRGESGTKSTWLASAFAAERLGKWIADLGAERFETDGYPRLEPTARGPIDTAQDSRHTAASLRLRRAVGEAASWFLRVASYDEDRAHGTPLAENASENLQLRAGAEWRGRGVGLWRVDLSTESQEFSQFLTSVNRDRTAETPSFDQFDVPSGADAATLQWSAAAGGRHYLSTGLDLRSLDGETNELDRYVDGVPTLRRKAGGDQRFAGIFVSDLVHLSADWQLDLGLRVDRWELANGSLLEVDVASGEIERDLGFAERSRSLVSASLGAIHRVGPRLTSRAAAFTGFRAPTTSELYRPFLSSNNRVTAPSAELDPETLVGAELGLDWAAGSRWSAGATLFWNEVDDAIAEVALATVGPEGGVVEPCGAVGPFGTCRQRRNVGTIRNLGLELEVTARPSPRWTLGASYLWDDNEITDAPGLPQLVGSPARQVAEHQATFRIDFRDPRLVDVGVQGRYLGERFDDDAGTLPIDSAFVLDLSVRRRIGAALDLYAAVENALDERIEISGRTGSKNLGVPRLVRFGVRFRPFDG